MAKTPLDKLIAKIEKAEIADYIVVVYDGDTYYTDVPVKVFEVDEYTGEVFGKTTAKALEKFVARIEKANQEPVE